jgi:uncharacterized Fe-S cluster protein YjdI
MQEYRNHKIVVRYDPAICIHAGECVRGLSSVFERSDKALPLRRAGLRTPQESPVSAIGSGFI